MSKGVLNREMDLTRSQDYQKLFLSVFFFLDIFKTKLGEMDRIFWYS